MDRMKTFMKYLILFLLFYAFVSVMSYWFVKSTLVPFEEYNIDFQNPYINIQEAKVSKVSGYVKGTITNNQTEKIANKYIKIDFISENNNVLISRYIDISTVNPGDTVNFDVQFNAENIKTFKMYLTDEKETQGKTISQSKIVTALGGVFLVWLIFFK